MEALHIIQTIAEWWWFASDIEKYTVIYGKPPHQFEDGSYDKHFREKRALWTRGGFLTLWAVLDNSSRRRLLEEVGL